MPKQFITGVGVITQRGDTIFTFSLTGEEVVRLCRVERFGEAPDGVNRKLDEAHALRIADAMLDPNTVWLEPIVGVLKGPWEVLEGKLAYDDGAYISIDDGQHRWYALSVLNPTERIRFSMPIAVMKDVPYERRLRIFRMQRNRKELDARLNLAQRHQLADWKHPSDGEAYRMLLQLNSDTTSPLKGRILLEEQVRRPYEGRHRPVGINGHGLYSTLRTLLSSKSPLIVLSPEKRCEVVMSMIKLAAKVWGHQWGSEQHILTTARGVNAVLLLLTSSPTFRMVVGEDFTQESLRRGLEFAASFDWSVGKNRNQGVRQIVDRLEQSLTRNWAAHKKRTNTPEAAPAISP